VSNDGFQKKSHRLPFPPQRTQRQTESPRVFRRLFYVSAVNRSVVIERRC